MAVRQYIGARYVPKFYEGSNGSAWDGGVMYEPLTIVQYLTNTYCSKKTVPATVGAPNLNPEYWANIGLLGEVTQEIEELESSVNGLAARVDTAEGDIDDLNEGLTNTKVSDFSKNKKIVFFGDSYMDDINDELLASYFPDSEIMNAGYGGSTIATLIQSRENLHNMFDRFRTNNPDFIPDIVVYVGGNNDAYVWSENEGNIRSDGINPFGSIAYPASGWNKTATAMLTFIESWVEVNPDIRFGVVPLINLSNTGYFNIAKGAIQSLFFTLPFTHNCGMLYNSQFGCMNRNNNRYWSSGHPTARWYSDVFMPIISNWIKAGLPNNAGPNTMTVFSTASNVDISAMLSSVGGNLLAIANQVSGMPIGDIFPPNLYVFSCNSASDLYSNPNGSLAAQPWGPGFEYTFSIASTPDNLYKTKINDTSIVTKVINIE